MVWYYYDDGTKIFCLPSLWDSFLSAAYPVHAMSAEQRSWKVDTGALLVGVLVAVFLANLRAEGGCGCPHEGSDHRLFGRTICRLQRRFTIENAEAPSRIWSLDVAKLSLRIDPRHPHLLVEWPAASQRLWRFRMGYRWDANARAYIFPALAFKKVDGPMKEYQTEPGGSRP